MSENKLLKHRHDQSKEDSVSTDGLPDTEIFDHVDISFLMNYSLDSDLKGLNDQKDLISHDSWVGSSPVALKGSLFEDEAGDSSSLKDALADEFMDLVGKEDAGQETESLVTENPFATENNQPFAVQEASSVQANEEDKSPFDPSLEKNVQDYQTSLPNKKLFSFCSHDKIQIGLDVGRQTIKYVVTGKSKKKKTIHAFGILENTFKKDHSEQDIVNYVLEGLKLKSSFPKARVSWNVYGPKVGLKRISLPHMKKQMLEDAVTWSAKKDMNLENEKAVIDYIELKNNSDEEDKHHHLLTVGCAEEFVDPRTSAFLNKKTTPFKVTPLPVTLWKLYQNSPEFDDQKNVALINIGAKTTIIAFINHGILEFFREIPTGGKDVTEALMGTIFYHGEPHQLEEPQAEELKLKYGFPHDDLEDITDENVPVKEFAVLIRPILERLGNEIRRSIDYYKEHFSKANIDHVYFLGGSAKLKNFTSFISDFIEEKIVTLNPPVEIEGKLSELDKQVFQERFLELAVPYSLAIDDDGSLNLVPAFVKKIQKLATVKKLSIYGVLFGFTFLALFSGYSHINSQRYQSEYRMLETQYKRLEPLKQKFDALKLEQGNLLNKKNIYSEELILDNPLPILMKAVSNLLPKGSALRAMELVENDFAAEVTSKPKKNKGNKNSKRTESNNPVDQKKAVLLSGVTLNPGPDAGISIANYMLSLSKTGLFESVKLNNQNYNEEEDELLFEIEAIVNQ